MRLQFFHMTNKIPFPLWLCSQRSVLCVPDPFSRRKIIPKGLSSSKCRITQWILMWCPLLQLIEKKQAWSAASALFPEIACQPLVLGHSSRSEWTLALVKDNFCTNYIRLWRSHSCMHLLTKPLRITMPKGAFSPLLFLRSLKLQHNTFDN